MTVRIVRGHQLIHHNLVVMFIFNDISFFFFLRGGPHFSSFSLMIIPIITFRPRPPRGGGSLGAGLMGVKWEGHGGGV